MSGLFGAALSPKHALSLTGKEFGIRANSRQAISKALPGRCANCMRAACCLEPLMQFADGPCRLPILMNAFVMAVGDVCKDSDLICYYGPNTLTCIGCALIE